MKKTKTSPIRVRMIVPVIEAAGLIPMTIVFAILFVVASFVVAAFEPSIDNAGDASWLMFQAVTTIGYGDYECTTFVGRTTIVLLSIYSVFYLALVTGAVVTFCQDTMQLRREESVAHFIDQLEHLPELSHEELVDLSARVKKRHRMR